MFISKYYACSYNKVFYSTEVKMKYEKNRIYIKAVKYKAQLKSVSKIKRIYRLYYMEFDLYNTLFQHLANGYIGTGMETAFEPDIIEVVYLI